ncbi:MAG: hypothetical protein ACJ0BQ_02400, partial [Coraliomargaritaceae bacterium]
SLSDSYDYLLELYNVYPDLENELSKVEYKITKAYDLANSIYDSDIDYSNFLSRKKALRTLRKIKNSIEDTIDYLECIAHPKPYYYDFWGLLKDYLMKKKFFGKPDYFEHYNFEDILNSLKEVRKNIKNTKKEIRHFALEAWISDFEQSDYFFKSSSERD